MIPNQLAIKPEETLVSVRISESQFKIYSDSDSVKIRYSRDNPFVFLLEDEV
jgi:hypothetical protein